MNRIRKTKAASFLIGTLPVGCKLCIEGKKLVIFITGLCKLPEMCAHYCPISEERKGKNVIFANDRPVTSFEDVLVEVKKMNAKGAGITGGDPLLVIDKTLNYISMLKKQFGDQFHIHLYCCSSPHLTIENLKRLKQAGLDEIRFHVEENQWSLMVDAKKIGFTVGAEVPAINLDELKKLGLFLSKNQLDFFNINEFEFSETNADALRKKGFTLKKDSLVAINGSEKVTMDFMNWALNKLTINIHFCTTSLKDGFQFKNRMKRTAKNVKKPYEVVTDDGLLLKGIISWENEDEKLRIKTLIEENFEIPEELYFWNEKMERLEIHWKILDESFSLFKKYNLKCGIVQELSDFLQTSIRYDPY
ncbi:MAG: radical SAM protein [Candidatus Lokiarchaeota archaeon]|nr:radical SAM protein [Candidatus Lokiarchaeota archaeon]